MSDRNETKHMYSTQNSLQLCLSTYFIYSVRRLSLRVYVPIEYMHQQYNTIQYNTYKKKGFLSVQTTTETKYTNKKNQWNFN